MTDEIADDTTPLTVWRCDSCGDDITSPTRSLVIWRRDDERRGFDFRIVHKSMDGYKCDPGAGQGFCYHTELENFLGANGLAYALSLLSPGPLMGSTDVQVLDFNGFVDLVRRTQTPWYEQARTQWDTEQTRDWFTDANQVYPYQPAVLERIAKQTLG
ncbi:Uncharacterised protein [Mycobacteroides abscessus subsp. massiliense]|uniref:hypothetical protein n=1 Tax=Mycobacteroides abscessus TaxID=36809 RepID=UPI0009A6CAC7|nr:hypothetical protein [Mycobacteroides abscessus]SKF35392.1 Uncharacterised protein [Mycobacteroides abscessus subsp. massiliense]SKF44120.1 Uncharacterised protein [Mycobacteroides abscessus subsp. massiliense]SKF45858.1 Uncharacterised protein [Mycobacteroides abscessus subsp. massiliense]SKF48952.1 Uncharacterised protein [Mycobacteroides abscessus subsp. massiliense]SKF49596.1 Uncharacterised protein [Mycobacteroides abscessus subsp. massiliense]